MSKIVRSSGTTRQWGSSSRAGPEGHSALPEHLDKLGTLPVEEPALSTVEGTVG